MAWQPAHGALGHSAPSDPLKKTGKTCLQPLGNLLDVHQRHVPNPALDTAVVRPVQPASLRRLLLVDLLLLPDAADGATKSDADVQWHREPSWGLAADA